VLQKRNDVAGDSISVIYNQKNDSPKYFVLKRSKLIFFIVGMPTITLIALVLGVIGLIHTSPFHLIDTYRQNSLAREAIAKTNDLIMQIKTAEEDKLALTKKLTDAEEQLKSKSNPSESAIEQPAQGTIPTVITSSAGLASLSLFRPIQGQKDRTRPATLNLSDFKVVVGRDNVNLEFNITPLEESKLAGHIIVLMKNELTVQIYPPAALNTTDYQINYSAGETFSTQRFRPVDANFLKPRKSGNYTFAVFIFAKNGDLLHNQSTILPVKF
jgi:hypothetical protein